MQQSLIRVARALPDFRDSPVHARAAIFPVAIQTRIQLDTSFLADLFKNVQYDFGRSEATRPHNIEWFGDPPLNNRHKVPLPR